MGISKWNAGIIRPVPVAPAGPYEDGAAPGVWTLDQVAYWQKQGLWPIAGNTQNFIEDMFSTTLYTGTGGANTLTTNVNLSGNGGLLWVKNRATTTGNMLTDTVRGPTNQLVSNTTAAQTNYGSGLAFLTNGFSFSGSDSSFNTNNTSYASWTFREQPKFFDVVTYTGTSIARTVSHNLGSAPGCVIIKNISAAGNDWAVWHRGVPTQGGRLNQTAQFEVGYYGAFFDSTQPTSSVFSVSSDNTVNGTGNSYVAYLFAHNAGGFGLTGTDNVVSCGSFTTDGTGAAGNITLGYEAQWLLIKRSDGVGSWNIIDVMRGSSLTSYRYLQPNASTAESNSTSLGQGIFPTATGFFVGTNFPAASATYLYIAIRRPMKVPTLGTSVFSVDTTTADSAITSTLKQTDMGWFKDRTTVANWFVADRLRGFTNAYYTPTLYTNATDAEVTPTTGDTLTAFGPTTTGVTNGVLYAGGAGVAANYPLLYSFKRAPGFFDEVCSTADASGNILGTHNLTVVPEMMIWKKREAASRWAVYHIGVPSPLINYPDLNSTAGYFANNWSPSTPTTTTFAWQFLDNSRTYVTYLFATCPGVSKVGSYTGTGALQTVACGFTSGARFVLVKRVDSTGDWYVWDSARGITSGTDPYLLLNSTAAEVTVNNYVDTDTTGFKVTAAAPAALNAVGGTYIFLAIA